MFYGHTVQDTRQLFYLSWNKYHQKQPLQPLEQQIVEVILDHPEYHSLFSNPPSQNTTHFAKDANPFLHLGLHLAIRDQINTDKPAGIQQIYQKLLQKYTNPLIVEHSMMDFLAKFLWRVQVSAYPPAEKEYLRDLCSLFSC